MLLVNDPDVSAPMATDGRRPTWPPAAQLVAALILTVCVAALGWTAYKHHHASDARVSNDYIIDLNHADHAELLQLPGVGESLAGRIEAYRDKHGPFQSVAELRNVHGIGPVTLARLSPYVGTGKSSGTVPLRARAFQGDGGRVPSKAGRPKGASAMKEQDQGDKP
jgi:competence ComEA-like helix-hairpin-helix protein